MVSLRNEGVSWSPVSLGVDALTISPASIVIFFTRQLQESCHESWMKILPPTKLQMSSWLQAPGEIRQRNELISQAQSPAWDSLLALDPGPWLTKNWCQLSYSHHALPHFSGITCLFQFCPGNQNRLYPQSRTLRVVESTLEVQKASLEVIGRGPALRSLPWATMMVLDIPRTQ